MCIQEYLQSRSVPFESFLQRPAPSATRRAQSVHVPGGRVAKGVLARSGEVYVLAVLPATHRVDLGRLGDVLGLEGLKLATEDEVTAIFRDCERGALPPFGRLYGLTTVVDASLATAGEIVFEGNLRHEGLRMRFRDYEAIEDPVVAQFAVPIAPKRQRPSQTQPH
ncbi:MAG: YbaK/EbsC family protein [Isosphaeraceae bacterium]|nr:YbaK/EbsC family protein [Isosphaeraceae bacterium]